MTPGSFPAATLIAPLAAAGEPVMYGMFPPLPADATTITPRFTAAFDAMEDASVSLPNAPPRDMLMTSA